MFMSLRYINLDVRFVLFCVILCECSFVGGIFVPYSGGLISYVNFVRISFSKSKKNKWVCLWRQEA